jgi:hypothetical protein
MGRQPRHNLHYAKYVLFHAYITFQETYLDKIIEIARIVNTNDRLIKIDVFFYRLVNLQRESYTSASQLCRPERNGV